VKDKTKPPASTYSDALPTTKTAAPADKTALAEGNTAFALELYGKLREGKGNLFLSPYSVSTALAMAYAGARGKTAQEMAAALKFGLKPEKLHPSFAALIHDFHGADRQKHYQLHVANALWRNKASRFLDEFQQTLRANYGGVLREVDFQGDPEASRLAINDWVKQKTQGKIPELLAPGQITPSSRMVLTNALYFKGSWDQPFNKAATRDEPFHVSADRKVNVPLMHQTDRFRYLDGGDFQALELAYTGRDLAMVVFLPRKVDGLAQFERGLTAEKLKKWLDALGGHQVIVYLPRFTMTSEFKLKPALAELGMASAFDPDRADFSGIHDGKEKIVVNEVIHKSFVEVNEEGTEAAAATAVDAPKSAAKEDRPPPPPLFRADRPFLFLIRDMRTGTILFLGRLTEPQPK
jgi:serpin B